jgi:hypothetical protein
MRFRRILTTPIVFAFKKMGYHIQPYAPPSVFPRDYDEETRRQILDAKNYSMTPVGRLVALCNAVDYIVAHEIPGDIVECGVWKGGSMMAAAQTLLRRRHTDRHLYLFDTFEGMSAPTSADRTWDGTSAEEILEKNRNPDNTNRFCNAPLEEVQSTMSKTGYDPAKIHFVKGKVETTLPDQAPPAIALLRLDTDWYESTLHELRHLFPRLSRGGIVIFDDYGSWQGARKAVDQYLKETGVPLFLNIIDDEARIAVKL